MEFNDNNQTVAVKTPEAGWQQAVATFRNPVNYEYDSIPTELVEKYIEVVELSHPTPTARTFLLASFAEALVNVELFMYFTEVEKLKAIAQATLHLSEIPRTKNYNSDEDDSIGGSRSDF